MPAPGKRSGLSSFALVLHFEGTEKGLDLKVLLDPLEEQFGPPTVLVKSSHYCRQQVEHNSHETVLVAALGNGPGYNRFYASQDSKLTLGRLTGLAPRTKPCSEQFLSGQTTKGQTAMHQ